MFLRNALWMPAKAAGVIDVVSSISWWQETMLPV